MPTNDDERDFEEERAQAQAVADEQKAEATAEGPWYVGWNEDTAKSHNRGYDTREAAQELVDMLHKTRVWSHAELFPDEGPRERKLRALGFRPLTVDGVEGMAIEIPVGPNEPPDLKAALVGALLNRILEDEGLGGLEGYESEEERKVAGDT